MVYVDPSHAVGQPLVRVTVGMVVGHPEGVLQSWKLKAVDSVTATEQFPDVSVGEGHAFGVC